MKPNLIIFISLVLVIQYDCVSAKAKRLIFRPLTADEVHDILYEIDREDVIPEGRVVTHGLAALKGFALGVTKGLAGSILFDWAMSEQGQQFISEMLNVTWDISTTPPENSTVPLPEEMCISSRSLNEIDDDNDDEIRIGEPGEWKQVQIESLQGQGREVGHSESDTLPSARSAELARGINCIVITYGDTMSTKRRRRRRSIDEILRSPRRSRNVIE